MFRINGHAHLLPKASEIPKFMKKKEVFWISRDQKFMHQKGWQRPIDHPSYFLEERLEWMIRHHINHEVIITLSQLYCNGFKKSLAYDVIRFQNDFNAQLQADYPDKFTSGFTINPAYTVSALREMDRCFADLDMRVLCLPTHFQNKEGEWLSIGDEKVDPIFQLAEKMSLSIQIHPYDAPKMIPLANRYWRFHLIWMCAQTADAHHMICSRNLHNEFQNIRFCFAHGSQFSHAAFGRRMQGFNGRPDLFEGASSPADAISSKNIYYDTLVHDTLTLQLLVGRVGTSQIVAGLDNPYPLGEMDGVKDSYPGKVLFEACNEGIITEDEKKEIWKDNVENWLNKKISQDG